MDSPLQQALDDRSGGGSNGNGDGDVNMEEGSGGSEEGTPTSTTRSQPHITTRLSIRRVDVTSNGTSSTTVPIRIHLAFLVRAALPYGSAANAMEAAASAFGTADMSMSTATAATDAAPPVYCSLGAAGGSGEAAAESQALGGFLGAPTGH